ncbi:IS110 family transposase [Burkholderia gladioli]|uniref:IS110 family transposase n=1 Tax=Burkholderia gladioli TaxID=28095 RepID=UPI001C2421CF|nr:IS110 family transposase [Burkholderia gladioli]MBU9173035.1 IS110 family transposase [Burkholderia gladioli]
MSAQVIGLDIAKNVIQVHGVNAAGAAVLTKRLKRSQVLEFFANLSPCLIAIEACAGSHDWARRLAGFGHRIKLIPAQYVKPFVRLSKTDARDAAAICEAARQPDMPTVAVNTKEQQAVQMLHRIRQRLMQERTALINQTRGLLGEYGIVFPIHVSAFKEGTRRLLADESDTLPALARDLLLDLCTELTALEERIDTVDRRVRRLAKEDERCARLQEIPGIGPVTATALIAAVGDARRYRSARHMAASFGLTPHEHSSGGKQKLLGISKRGDRYIRWLLVQGARSIMRFAGKRTDALSRWVCQLASRRGVNVAAAALANKLARIAWALLAKSERFATA